MEKRTRSEIEEALVKEHRTITAWLRQKKELLRNGADPDVIRSEVATFYEEVVTPHVDLEEGEFFQAAREEDFFLDEEAFRFAHENLNYHLSEMLSGAPDPDPVREIIDFIDLVNGHFEEEEHHLFTNDMEQIMESSGPE